MPEQIEQLPDGIYLDMSFEDYLGQNRISSSALTALMEGPSAFWASSWMNPDRPEREETEAMKLGRAYHAARLEHDTFLTDFVAEFTPDDMEEGSLLSDRDYKAWLKEHNEPQTKAQETVLERAERIEAMGGPDTWHASREEWERTHDNLTWLKPDQYTQIERDAQILRMNPEIDDLLSGGYPEVSILFTEPLTGVQCKIRPDYLRHDRVVHLKTWDSKSFGKPGNRAIVDMVRFNGHYRTGWFYQLGLSLMPELKFRIPDGSLLPPPLIISDWQDEQRANFGIQCWFLFLRRSGIPDVRARQLKYLDLPPGVEEQSIAASTEGFKPSLSAIARKANTEVYDCLNLFKRGMEIYGDTGQPWFPVDMLGELGDADFSEYWLDSMDTPR